MLVTDAGMPSVSDPGYRLVAAAVRGRATPSPPSPARAPCSRRSPSRRCRWTGSPSRASCRARPASAREPSPRSPHDPRTLVFFEAPHRIAETLAAMAEAFGADRPAAVCRELTKTYEEVRRAPLGELAGVGGRGRARARSRSWSRARRSASAPRRDGRGRRPAQGGARRRGGGVRAGPQGGLRRRGRGQEGAAGAARRLLRRVACPRAPRIGACPTPRPSTSRRRSTTSTTPPTSGTRTRRRPATSSPGGTGSAASASGS